MIRGLRVLAALAAPVWLSAGWAESAHAEPGQPAAAIASDSIRGTLRYKVRGLSAVQGGLLSGGIMGVATGVGLQASVRNMLKLMVGAAKLSGDASVGQMETYLRTGKGFDFSGAPVSAGYDIHISFLLVGDGKGTYRLHSGTGRYSGSTDTDVTFSGDKGNVHRFTDQYRGEGSAALTPENASITLTVTGSGADRRAEFDVNLNFPVTIVGKTRWSAMGGASVITIEDKGDVTTTTMTAFGSTHTENKPGGAPIHPGVAYHRSGALDSVLAGRETWQDLADSGVLVEWRLGTPLGEDVQLAIDGPACACVEGERMPGTQVTWSAEASEPGGTFGPFTIQAAGVAPKVVTNAGGRLVLEPARGTGIVTLEASYTRQGRKTTATKSVSFCVMDSISVADGERDFAFDDASPGMLGVPVARTQALYNGADAGADLAWTFERIGPPAETTMSPEQPRGRKVTVYYKGLPALNGAFGRKRIEVKLAQGPCDCRRTSGFQAFYSPTAANHPAAGADALGEQPVPNWYYYMSQTSALRGIGGIEYARQRTSSDGIPAIGQFDETSGKVFLTARLWQAGCAPAVPRGGKPVALASARGGSSGIDCVAETARHEDRHRQDDAAWWPGGYSMAEDVDFDRVPRAVEEQRPGCRDTSGKSCDERPFREVGDREINAYWTGWAWPKGSAKAEDWACGPLGKQWGDGINCAE